MMTIQGPSVFWKLGDIRRSRLDDLGLVPSVERCLRVSFALAGSVGPNGIPPPDARELVCKVSVVALAKRARSQRAVPIYLLIELERRHTRLAFQAARRLVFGLC